MNVTTAEEFVDHVQNCLRPVAGTIVCDADVSGDEVIGKMVASGEWEVQEGVDYFAGKRMRYLVKVK